MHPHPLVYPCLRADGPVEFCGDLEAGAWAAAAWTEDFQDILGPVGPAPSLRTRAKMLWDHEALYIGAEMEEPHLWATYDQHDSVIFHENDFEAFFDPDGDNHCYFEYEVNALGTDWDLFLPKPYRDQGTADNSWEACGLRKRVSLRGTLNDPTDTDDGWTVELAFPWGCFAHAGYAAPKPQAGEHWRVNFSRVEWDVEPAPGGYRKIPGRPEHNWVWSAQHAVDMHRPELWGYVRFLLADEGPGWQDPAWPHLCRAMEGYWAARKGGAPGPWESGPVRVEHGSRITRIFPKQKY